MLQQNSNLIKHIIQGDTNSFEKFFHDFFPKLYHYIYDFVRDKEVAKELVHESFIKLWESRSLLRPDSNIEAYLITICRNKCLNFLKHKKIILSTLEHICSESDIEIFSDILSEDYISQIDFESLQHKVNDAISKLPDQCRKVFELSRFKQKKYKEIATFLNISQKTVEAHMSLALKKLKEELKEFL